MAGESYSSNGNNPSGFCSNTFGCIRSPHGVFGFLLLVAKILAVIAFIFLIHLLVSPYFHWNTEIAAYPSQFVRDFVLSSQTGSADNQSQEAASSGADEKEEEEEEGELPPLLGPASALINYNPFPWLILEKDICPKKDATSSSSSNSPFILLVVPTAAKNFAKRASIRATWANPELPSSENLKILFALGYVENDTAMMEKVKEESSRYHDIIQQEFIEHYKNMTYKSIMWLKWISQYCPNAFQVVKVDDDVFVHRTRLIEFIKSMYDDKKPDSSSGWPRTITCFRWINTSPQRQGESGRHVLTREEYSRDKYMDYCSGAAYILSGDLPAVFYQVSLVTKYLWIDDVYVTGLVREKVDGVRFRDFPRGALSIPGGPAGDMDSWIFVHGDSADKHRQLWKEYMEYEKRQKSSRGGGGRKMMNELGDEEEDWE